MIGRMHRKFQLRDRYVLDLTGDAEQALDRRLALAIGLDTLQNRWRQRLNLVRGGPG